MTWKAEDNVRGWDLWKGNDPSATTALDLQAALAQNPLLEYVITRFAGGSSGADLSGPRNYDAILAAQRHPAPYLVINPVKPMDAMFELWKTVIGARRPKVFWWDCELDGGLSAPKITTYTREVLRLAQIEWSFAIHGIYTGGWWWNDHIVHGWEHVFPLWAGQYPWEKMLTATTGEQYHAFAPLEAKLPIGNSFTPAPPKGWKEAGVQPVVWQFSEEGRQPGVPGRVDLNFVDRSWFASVYGEEPPIPVALPTPITLTYAKGAVALTVVEV